ncbi:type II methionyl aminopeptidase [Candidatus Woesearchaeota archaeon]|nr:type II methionyl aminopeptidase [Candidatus Woesearchaeota archaeon]
MENLRDYEKAGKIAAECLEFGRKLIKVNSSLFEVAEAVEKKIYDLGGKPAFPVNISINEIAAHFTPEINDKTIFKKGDLIKLDVGVHVNGCIGDNACTIDLGGNKDLVKASEEALEKAIKIIKPGIKLRDIGKEIQEVIIKAGFSPIRNLCGHQVDQYVQHAGLTIPNYDNGSEIELEEGMIIAIEPFATTGEGVVIDGKPSGIFRLIQAKNTRNMDARKIIKFIEENFKTLPFAKRWLKQFNNLNFNLQTLEREGIIEEYKMLVERSKGLVSQAEKTVLVGEKAKVLTKTD